MLTCRRLPGTEPARCGPGKTHQEGTKPSERPAGSTTWASREPHKNPTNPRPAPAPTGIPRTRRHSAAHLDTRGKIGPYMSTEQRKPRSDAGIPVLVDGGQGQDRTVDLPLFRRLIVFQPTGSVTAEQLASPANTPGRVGSPAP